MNTRRRAPKRNLIISSSVRKSIKLSTSSLSSYSSDDNCSSTISSVTSMNHIQPKENTHSDSTLPISPRIVPVLNGDESLPNVGKPESGKTACNDEITIEDVPEDRLSFTDWLAWKRCYDPYRKFSHVFPDYTRNFSPFQYNPKYPVQNNCSK